VSDVQDQSRAAWQQLDEEWQMAQEAWADSTTEYFSAEFWTPLQSEAAAYLRAVAELAETLRAAQRAAQEQT